MILVVFVFGCGEHAKNEEPTKKKQNEDEVTLTEAELREIKEVQYNKGYLEGYNFALIGTILPDATEPGKTFIVNIEKDEPPELVTDKAEDIEITELPTVDHFFYIDSSVKMEPGTMYEVDEAGEVWRIGQ